MKDQFFADQRDLLKYDLLLEILQQTPSLARLTFIPMLTPNDGSNNGKRTRYPRGNRRQELYNFLQGCLRQGKRDIVELRRLFRGSLFEYVPYGEETYFQHETRDDYFQRVPDSTLKAALVSVDPDNGLEVPSTRPGNGHKYLRYSEVSDLLRRMDGSSVLMVFQFLPREEREAYFYRISQEIRRRLGVAQPLCVTNNVIAFLLLTKRAATADSLRSLLAGYAERMGDLRLVPVRVERQGLPPPEERPQRSSVKPRRRRRSFPRPSAASPATRRPPPQARKPRRP